jgi:hypothetical protein
MEEEREVDAFHGALLAEPEKLREQIRKGSAQIFGTNQIITSNEVRESNLGSDAAVHVLYDQAGRPASQGSPNSGETPETLTLRRFLEIIDLFAQNLEHVNVVFLGLLLLITAIVKWPSEAMTVRRRSETVEL